MFGQKSAELQLDSVHSSSQYEQYSIPEVGTNNIISKAQRNKAQRSF